MKPKPTIMSGLMQFFRVLAYGSKYHCDTCGAIVTLKDVSLSNRHIVERDADGKARIVCGYVRRIDG